MNGRLNLFQATMLHWRELHPYNAVHVVRVPAPFEGGPLEAAIAAELESGGLTGFELDADRRRYAYHGGKATPALALLPDARNAEESLRAEIERQLNTRFPVTGRFDPFRFFARVEGDAFHLGLAYDHFVAGGDSIAVLLHRIAGVYCGTRRAGGRFDVYPATYTALFRRHAGAFLRGLPQLRTITAGCRRSYRPHYADCQDGRTGFVHARVAPATLGAAARTARAWGVTRNDLLLALLLETLSPLAAGRHGEIRRNELAVASIVNMRRDYQPEAATTFGQFLSSFRVTHPVPEGVGLSTLARDVHAETERAKRGKLYLQTLLGIAVGAALWHFQTPLQRSRFHGKSYPLWGGVTTLDSDALWRAGEASAAAPVYLRGVPTGPLAPLVLAATFAADGLSLGLTFRTTTFSRETVDAIAAALVHRIHDTAA